MTPEATTVAMAAVIDALALVQAQLDRVEESNGRIEAQQRDILQRLDTVDAGQAAVPDLLPVLEMILARSIEDRDSTQAKLSRIAQLAAFAHAASLGNGAPLPVDAADDPLLEQYLLTQPADRVSTERALVEWRRVASGASSTELSAILTDQYEPSPSDTPETRVLRYRLAAITRAEIAGRGVAPPTPPTTTVERDASVSARSAKSDQLARLWRAGESAALFGEPELAGALDLFALAEVSDRAKPEEKLSAELATYHRALGDRIASGERPSTHQAGIDRLAPLETGIEPERPR